MKKIGIVTPFKVANYGTKLQAYAISKYMAQGTEYEVEIINFSPSDDRRLITIIRKAFSIKRNIARFYRFKSKKNIDKNIDGNRQKERNQSINAFDTNLPLGEKIGNWQKLKDASKGYDCVVCGSDQIWLPDNLKDQYYTLEFCDEKIKKGSYAASLGVETLNSKQKYAYKRFLKRLDFISVREDVGRDLLNSFYKEKEITWVCDPTLLLSKEEWERLEKRPKFLDSESNDYVFCYFLGTSEWQRQSVYEFAKEKGLSIFSIANFKGYCEADTKLSDVQLYDLTVNEFLYLIHNASLVCTDSMLATIFSTIFESDFVTFERFKNNDMNSRNSRIYSLLQVMGLEDRLLTSGRIPDAQINYNKVTQRKEKYIELSKCYIKEEVL